MSEIQRAIAGALQHGAASGTGRRGTMPAPVGGWNTRDNLAAMEPQFATELRNFFPEAGRITSRKGSALFADTQAASPIRTIHNHRDGAVSRIFACSDSAIYDVTDVDTDDDERRTGITEEVTAGITSGRWWTANLNGNSIFVNGENAPLRYDATGNWVAHGFTGPTDVSKLTHVTVFKNRLFFLEKDTATLWYGALNAITGALTSFPVGMVNERGGNLVAVGSLTLDSGIGVDDLLALFFQDGSIAVYAGVDPGNVDTWQLSGLFQVGPLVGDRPLVKLGGDLIAITSDGYIPILQFLRTGRQANLAISDAIAPTINEKVAAERDKVGWEAHLFTAAKWLLFNVPSGGAVFDQHVLNTQTGAWCQFRGMNAYTWLSMTDAAGDRLFYGASQGRVVQANVGQTDMGDSIEVLARGAYNYFGSPYDKVFRLIRAHLETSLGGADIGVGADTDFRRSVPKVSNREIRSTGVKWNTVEWDTSKWAGGVLREREWLTSDVIGTALSMYIAARVDGSPVVWNATDVVYDQSAGALAIGG